MTTFRIAVQIAPRRGILELVREKQMLSEAQIAEILEEPVGTVIPVLA